jgi:hypothetical protein
MPNALRKMIVAPRNVLIALVVLTTVASAPSSDASSSSNPYEGMWVIDMKPDSASERKAAVPFEERISFINGKPVPRVFSQYGFEATTWDFDFSTMTFTVILKSRAKGQLIWSGKIKSTSHFHGDLIWTRPGGAVWNFTYDARKMPEPAEPIVSESESAQ